MLVSGAPDAGKVHAHGPGIENGLLSTFQGQFVVETAGAGSGQLTVKVRGPRGSGVFFLNFLRMWIILNYADYSVLL